MHCVILSAGKNSRLDTGIPKSLLEVDGMSLLERHIRNFRAEGVTDFCVVTGYNPGKLREMALVMAGTLDVNIELVHNERYDLENGYSLSVTREWIQKKGVESFFLTMGDHIFQPEFVRYFVEASKNISDPLALAVDSPGISNQHIDLEDVTKVLANKTGNILSIGKSLTEYNFYDTGLFYLNERIFSVLDDCFNQQQYTLSHMVQRLAHRQEAKTIEIPGYLWNDVDNPSDLQNTLDLFKTALK